MPLRQNDIQQIHRKRYIGNGSSFQKKKDYYKTKASWIDSFSVHVDIVCIVFMEGKKAQTFNPSSIRSQFLHVFIIVYYEKINQQDTWRVEVLHNKDVKSFSPSVPSPSIFYNQQELRGFLLLKRKMCYNDESIPSLLKTFYLIL